MNLDDLINDKEAIFYSLTENKLDTYQFTQEQLYKVDVSTDEAYRRKYTGFYRVRLPKTQAYDTYFSMLEKYKSDREIGLEQVLNELKSATGRIETSFGSKLLATINPDIAPLDSIVLSHLGLSLPKSGSDNRLGKCVDVHEKLMSELTALLKEESFQTLKTEFQRKHAKYTFTDIKILDLMLWQHRPG